MNAQRRPAGRLTVSPVLSLALIAIAVTLLARIKIGVTVHLGMLPLLVAPVLAAYLPRLNWRGLAALSLAATLPVLGIASITGWFQLLLLTAVSTVLVAALFLPFPSAPTPENGSESIARTVVLIAWCGWLTWPIWLANAWPNPAVGPWLDRLLPFNPLAAVGGVLVDLGDWTHLPVAYQYLVNLGQDVPYEPPASAWPAIAVHGVAAVLVLAARWRIATRRRAVTSEKYGGT